MRPRTIIVGERLRVTADFRDDCLREAGRNIERRIEAQRAWWAEQKRKHAGRNVIRFGGAAKS